MNVDAGEEEAIREGRRRRERGARANAAFYVAFTSSSSSFFFPPFRTRSCAFRGGLAKLINVNLLT